MFQVNQVLGRPMVPRIGDLVGSEARNDPFADFNVVKMIFLSRDVWARVFVSACLR